MSKEFLEIYKKEEEKREKEKQKEKEIIEFIEKNDMEKIIDRVYLCALEKWYEFIERGDIPNGVKYYNYPYCIKIDERDFIDYFEENNIEKLKIIVDAFNYYAENDIYKYDAKVRIKYEKNVIEITFINFDICIMKSSLIKTIKSEEFIEKYGLDEHRFYNCNDKFTCNGKFIHMDTKTMKVK